jgi:HlyD family secretion protein
MSGVVTALNVRAGETAGSPAVVVSDLTQLEVSINLDEADVAQVAVGQRARIILDAFPDAELTGEVVTVAPVATVTSGVVLYPVTVQLAPTTQPVRSGMTADVEVVLNSRENALIIPLRAVQSMDDGDFVLRQAGGAGTPGSGRPGPRGGAVGFELVPVTLGLMNDSDVEVTSGLSEGDVVSVTALPTQGGQGGFGPVGMFGGGDN